MTERGTPASVGRPSQDRACWASGHRCRAPPARWELRLSPESNCLGDRADCRARRRRTTVVGTPVLPASTSLPDRSEAAPRHESERAERRACPANICRLDAKEMAASQAADATLRIPTTSRPSPNTERGRSRALRCRGAHKPSDALVVVAAQGSVPAMVGEARAANRVSAGSRSQLSRRRKGAQSPCRYAMPIQPQTTASSASS
jgi:hypothetical protein